MPAEAFLFLFQKTYRCFPLGRVIASILGLSPGLKFQATQEMPMLKRLIVLAAMTLALVITVSADVPFPPCMPSCSDSFAAR